MDLFIETLTGTAFELRVSPNDTVMSIKSKIQRVEGIPVGQQHLIWKNDELSDHQSLQDCSIPGGATLRLVLGMRGGPINTYKPPPPVAATAAAIQFTPTIRLATSKISCSSSQSKNKRKDGANAVASSSSSSASRIERSARDKLEPDSQKHITFFIFNSGENLDLLRVVDGPQGDNPSSDGQSTTSLLGPEESCESSLPTTSSPNSRKVATATTNLLSASVAAQSLPFLQTEPSALSCEQLPQLASTTSEPSVLKATECKNANDSQPPSAASAATALLAGLLYATHGPDSSAYYSDTDDCLSSDCCAGSGGGGGKGGASYWLRPPSPEWDYRDIASPLTAPADDFPLLYGNHGDDYNDDDDDDDDDDNDSLAELEDYLLYYRSGDVLFGPPPGRKSSAQCRGEKESPRKAQAKREEREFMAAKVKSIKAQLYQAKESRIQRKQKTRQGEVIEENECDQIQSPSFPLSAVEEPTETSNFRSSHASFIDVSSPSKIRSSWINCQRFRKTSFLSPPHHRRPYTTTSTVDLPTAAAENAASSSASADNLLPMAASLLMPSNRFSSAFADTAGLRRQRGTAPAKTTSETNLDAIAMIPGFVKSDIGYFSRSVLGPCGNSRQRRFGTLQPPDISKIVCSRRLPPLDPMLPPTPTTTTTSETLFPPLFPPSSSTANREHWLRPPTLASGGPRFFGFPFSSPSNRINTEETSIRGRPLALKKTTHLATAPLPNALTSAPLPDVVSFPPISTAVRANLTGGGVNVLSSRPAAVVTQLQEDNLQQQRRQHHTTTSTSPTKPRQEVSEPSRRSPRAKTNRCASCNRKTGLANSYTCRCERNFCSRHRYAELHACAFDYKADGRRCIRESNPVITAAKLPKI